MKKESQAFKVTVLDQEYLVSCPDDEKGALISSAKYLNEKMMDTRDGGNVIGMDRIAVITALNLAHEVIDSGAKDSGRIGAYTTRIKELNTRIEEVLENYKLAGLN
jgi:cell division protein ZapA